MSAKSYGQEKAISAVAETAVENARSLYIQSLGGQSSIYTGPEYTGYPYPIRTGHPYFEASESSSGELLYDGLLYQDIPLWYDIVKGEVLTTHTDGHSRLVLSNEKIGMFRLSGHEFVRISGPGQSGIPDGFYDRIYHGQSEVLVRRTKRYMERVGQEEIWGYIIGPNAELFLKYEGEYYPVSGESSVLKLFRSRARDIKALLRENRVKFRKEPERAMILIAGYIDARAD